MADNDNNIYNANPNQFVYDTPHETDLLVEVMDIYFAEKIKKYKWQRAGQNYTAKKNDIKIAAVLKKFEREDRKNIQAKSGLTEPLKVGDLVEVFWDERLDDGFDFQKVNSIWIKKQVTIVAKCTGDSGKLNIEIFENKWQETDAVYPSPVVFMEDGVDRSTISISLNGSGEYTKDIYLHPKGEAETKNLIKNFEKHILKNAYLFFKANVSDTDDEIKYAGDTNEFLNTEIARFEVVGKGVCPVDPKNRSHFVIHNTAGAQAMGEAGIKSHVNFDGERKRSKAHAYILRNGTVITVWPFSEKNVWATRTESKGSYTGKKIHIAPGQMFHIELSYGTKEGSPSDEQYNALADLYIQASDTEGCWPIIAPHAAIDAGISGSHVDPENFDYPKFYKILKDKNVPIDNIPKFDGIIKNKDHQFPPIL